MTPTALFGISALFSFTSSATFAKLYLWPRPGPWTASTHSPRWSRPTCFFASSD